MTGHRKRTRPGKPKSITPQQRRRPAAAHRWLPLLVLAAGTLVYLNSFSGTFLLDDERHIANNEAIRQLWPIWDLLGHRDRPIINLSLAVNYALDDLNVWGYHAVNLSVHLLAGLTLFGIVRRTLLRERFGVITYQAAPWLALSAALLWVVHPLQTQSVTYLIQRSESMMGLFYLLTLYCVIRGADSRRALRWYAAAIAACALGMGSKAVMVTTPVLVLLYDRVFLSPSWRQAFRRRWGLYLGLAATWTVVALCGVVQGVFNPPADADATVGFGYKGVTPLEYAATQPGVILHYLRLSLWPHPLCLDYDWPVAKTLAAVVLPGMVVLALIVATGSAFWRWAGLGFLGAWFFVNLAPTSSIIPIKDIAFEHRMYLPLAAVVVLAVLAGWWGLRRLFGGRRLPGALAAAAVIVPAVLLGYGTVQRNRDYHSQIAMWSDVVAQRPNSPRAHYNLAHYLLKSGRIDQAITHARRAIQLEPDEPDAYNTLGIALAVQGKTDQAIIHFTDALRLVPDFADAHINLGKALASQGKSEPAVAHFVEALRLNPEAAEIHNTLGAELFRQGRIDQAIEHYAEALRLQPDFALAHCNWGAALIRKKDLAGALEHFSEALRLEPGLALAHKNRALALAYQGKIDDAIAEYRRALRREPHDADTHFKLGLLLSRQGWIDEAIGEYREALRLDPGHARAQQALQATLAKQHHTSTP